MCGTQNVLLPLGLPATQSNKGILKNSGPHGMAQSVDAQAQPKVIGPL